MIFYGWWNPWFVLLMLGTTALDYNLGSMIANADKLKERGGTDEDVQRRKKLGVVLSVTSNLAALAFFKYTAFAVDSVQGISSAMGWGSVAVPAFFQNIILPAGISFYVFQSLSYCVDLYRGHAKPAHSFLDFTCFVSLFPHLVAGPIVRYGIIDHQMRHRVHTVEALPWGSPASVLVWQRKSCWPIPWGHRRQCLWQRGRLSHHPGGLDWHRCLRFPDLL